MNDDLKELGITPDHDMEEGEKPGEAVDDRVAAADDKDDETEKPSDEVSLEDEEGLRAAGGKPATDDEDEAE